MLSLVAALAAASVRPRAAIVTGGTRGVGRGISEALAADGFDLLVTYNTNADAAEKAATELRSAFGCAVETVGGDISLEATRDDIFARYDQTFKASHALGAVAHNAGQYVGVTSANCEDLAASSYGFGDGSMLDADGRMQLDVMKYYQRMYGDAFVDLCERGAARMGEEGGSLIGISSPGCTLQYNPNLGYDMPGSGKCIMEYAMRLFAVRCASKGINCNVVIPGFTDSDGWAYLAKGRGMTKEELLSGIASRLSPSGQPMSCRQLGDAVAFLCSPKGRLITGVSLPVDGGVHLKT
uniref:3-oxoacyl-[acyl-carrier-protein] reductase n=1 Tax=Calcidiscus leptoporus TaxID=127549 RepID=A0A7S0J461_9EUKA|mmetsp:Transcript_37194/g.86911  ORF Transcript_37194/g.86911 Transcript_37194/m.86911 type:complete len:296 (+) Transcript_37194:78-965(+)